REANHQEPDQHLRATLRRDRHCTPTPPSTPPSNRKVARPNCDLDHVNPATVMNSAPSPLCVPSSLFFPFLTFPSFHYILYVILSKTTLFLHTSRTTNTF